ncbi:ECF-type sigma factor [Lentisalinibacter orientalis]|uniref:ECF-type sigma factor n=1 Tax=Lentisalinibacter orientalis TaxID=2992241 RepID=UPI003863749C
MSEPSPPDAGEITQLLRDWADGDAAALESLTPLVYGELRRIAQRLFGSESPGHTLQPTALVHEAYEKLIGVDTDWQDRTHFYALAARMMRRLLVNHANARKAAKRGGDALRVTLDESAVGSDADEDLLDLDEALSRLAGFDERMARILELHYFGGLTHEQAARVVGVSEPTSRRDLRLARAWLRKYMSEKKKPD